VGLAAIAGFQRRNARLIRRLLIPVRFDAYAQQRQLVYLRLGQESTQDMQQEVQTVAAKVKKKRASLSEEMVRFVVPAFGLVAANQAMTAVDKAFVGHISSMQLAGMGSAAVSFDSVSYMTTFINTAGLSLLGAALALKNKDEANKVRSHALVFATGLGAGLGLFLSTFAVPVCRLLGGAPDGPMLGAAQDYLSIRAMGIPLERMISIGTTFCLASKDGSTPLIVTTIGSVANVLFDWLLCCRLMPARAAGGSAAASVLATAVSGVYLIYRLRRKGRWPNPLVWPRKSDAKPFLGFAGPVFLLLLVKSLSFTTMTAYAAGLGTATAAAHQVYVSLLFLTAVAVGTPLSWAAQSFMPGYLTKRSGDGGEEAAGDREAGSERTGDSPAVCLRALLSVAAGCSSLAAGAVIAALRYGPKVFTSDQTVVAALMNPHSSMPLVGFVMLYPIFLALEGTLIAARRLRVSLLMSGLLLVTNTVLFRVLKHVGWLSLSALWSASAASLLLATAASLLAAANACDALHHDDQAEAASDASKKAAASKKE